jgi:hypothetical protein
MSKQSSPASSSLRRRLIDGGMSSVSLFFCEMMSCEAMPGHSCSALATDVHALYVAWCDRLGVKALNVPHFVHELKVKHGVAAHRQRYALGGKQRGPHCVLILNPRSASLGEQIGEFRRFATDVRVGLLE